MSWKSKSLCVEKTFLESPTKLLPNVQLNVSYISYHPFNAIYEEHIEKKINFQWKYWCNIFYSMKRSYQKFLWNLTSFPSSFNEDMTLLTHLKHFTCERIRKKRTFRWSFVTLHIKRDVIFQFSYPMFAFRKSEQCFLLIFNWIENWKNHEPFRCWH